MAHLGKKLPYRKRAKFSEEHRKNIGLSSLGRKVSDETKQKISIANKGRRRSEEAKQKMSLSHKGKKLSKEHREKIGNALRGRKYPERRAYRHSEEAKKKISMASKGRVFSEEHKKKISVAHKGKKISLETRKKNREARLNRIFSRKDTSIEILIQNGLNQRNIVFEKHVPTCGVCIPDVVFPEKKVAVFCDGDYWHSKEFENGKVWKRDRKQNRILKDNDWIPLRFWEHEINKDVEACIDIIEKTLEVR